MDEGLFKQEYAMDLASMNTEDLNNIILDLEKAPEIISETMPQCDLHDCNADTQHLDRLPDLVPMQSQHNFDVLIDGLANNSNNWLFLPDRQKLFIKMNAVITIKVSYTIPSPKQPLYVRAMILFSHPDEMHMPVKRCANHRQTDSKGNNEHILKCCHPNVTYHGMEDGKIFKERLSVVVPLIQHDVDDDGCANVPIGLEFGCQNSCSAGINRKTTSIVFTLEDQYFKILGKKSIEFKVCSCPKRDADRETNTKSRHSSGKESYPKGKRPRIFGPDVSHIKIEPADAITPPSASLLPNEARTIEITLPNTEIALDTLKFAKNAIASLMVEDKHSSKQIFEFYRNIKQNIKTLKDSK